jgi:hypothetical protein
MPRIALLLLVASSCFGQRFTSTFSGWGSVAHPGTGFPTGTARSGYGAGYRAGGYGRYRSGGYGYGGVLAAPYFAGGYGYGGYGYGYGDPSAYVDPNAAAPPVAPPGGAAPPVIINQYFGVPPCGQGPEGQDDPSVHIYSQPSAQPTGDGQASPDARTYLIAYKDHSVYTALAYWIEGHTLNYVTTSNTHNQADLSLIDVDFTTKLNQDRGMPVNFIR